MSKQMYDVRTGKMFNAVACFYVVVPQGTKKAIVIPSKHDYQVRQWGRDDLKLKLRRAVQIGPSYESFDLAKAYATGINDMIANPWVQEVLGQKAAK